MFEYNILMFLQLSIAVLRIVFHLFSICGTTLELGSAYVELLTQGYSAYILPTETPEEQNVRWCWCPRQRHASTVPFFLHTHLRLADEDCWSGQ